jgi:hypothetical protein
MTTVPGRIPLTIFCGKGGVGKTTLALAYGLGHALQGKTALVVTSHPLPELAVSVSLAGLKTKFPRAAAGLFVIHIDPREILHQYVKHHIPSAMLADAVLSSRIYQGLVDVAPGLKEMVFLHRLQQLAEERSAPGSGNESPVKYHVVVWDTPSTGHFLQTLDVSRHFGHYLSGPFAALGKEIAQFFSEPSNLALFPVTTLEEMAVEETLELCGKLAGKLGMRPRAVVCNMASPFLAASGNGGAQLDPQIGESAGDANMRFILDRLAIERSLYEKLRSEADTTLHIVERKHRSGADLDLLLDLAGQVEEMPIKS